jgi:predicted metal-binding membrane protein
MNLLATPGRKLVLVLGVVAIAWAVTIERMQGMDSGPGTDLGGLGWFLGIWVAMMAAMMLPSAVPAARVVAGASRALPTVLFGIGYLAAWTAFGVAAYGLFRLVTSLEIERLAWDRDGPYITGAVIVVAGIYELTPLKERLLRACRIPHEADDRGALQAGLTNGSYCVGCCVGLMAVLFALGVMSLFWTVVIAGVIFVEKVLPNGLRLSRFVGIALIALGLWVAVSPGSVPMLTEPDEAPAMQMEM